MLFLRKLFSSAIVLRFCGLLLVQSLCDRHSCHGCLSKGFTAFVSHAVTIPTLTTSTLQLCASLLVAQLNSPNVSNSHIKYGKIRKCSTFSLHHESNDQISLGFPLTEYHGVLLQLLSGSCMAKGQQPN